DQYRSGHVDEAKARVGDMDRRELAAVVKAILVAPRAHAWNVSSLIAAGTLHDELYLASRRLDIFAADPFHLELARRIFDAVQAARVDDPDAARHGARAAVLFFLLEAHLPQALRRIAEAVERWPGDRDLLLLQATILENEATNPWGLQAGRARASRLVA